MGKKAFELRIQLSSQRLVVAENQRGLVDVLDDIRDGKRLARPSNAKKCLRCISIENAACQLFNGLWLVACWLVIGN